MKCTLDNLKLIVALGRKINLTSFFDTKSSLIWIVKLSRTVTKLLWVIWSIFSSVSSDMLRYVMEKLSLGELTRVSILLANEISMFEGWYLCIVK